MSTSTVMNRGIMKPNLSFSDRQVRFVIGATMIAGTLVVMPETIGMWSIALLASIPFIAMAINGWDPLYALIGKSAYVEGEEDIQQRSWTCPNVGIIDRAVRAGVGMVLLATLLTMNVMTAELVVTLLAIPLVTSAIIAWDPLYAMLGINSFASKIDVETAELDASEQTLGACYVFPQPVTASGSLKQAA